MFPKKERVKTLLKVAIDEMSLLQEMCSTISSPDDFASSTSGMIVFRACGMSLQYITESFVKIRNICSKEFFKAYKNIPWDAVFGMRNFLSHEYGDVDTEGIFNTIKTNIPDLQKTALQIQNDISVGKLDIFLAD